MSSNLARVSELVQGVASEDAAVLARCELAKSVAAKLDEATSDTAPQSQTAVATLSKELRSCLDDLSSVESKREQLRAEIFGP